MRKRNITESNRSVTNGPSGLVVVLSVASSDKNKHLISEVPEVHLHFHVNCQTSSEEHLVFYSILFHSICFSDL